jgi:hypothetical protein
MNKRRESQISSLYPTHEPRSEQPSPGSSQPVPTFHSPMLATYIQPEVSSCKAEQAFCYKFSGLCHLFYEPIGEYMELHFLHVLEPPNFIMTSTLGGKLKDVIVLLSRLHYLLSVTDRVNGLQLGSYLNGYGGS